MDTENWNADAVGRGFAGRPSFRMFGTEADLNEHWVELFASETTPPTDGWPRVTCAGFKSDTGMIFVMSIMGGNPLISAKIEPGEYSLFVAGNNLGVDRSHFSENENAGNADSSIRKDLECYRIFLVPGRPSREGRIKDT
ncbi:hypothetical protein ACG873_19805 [Mesorhizobium sp. AaZ16]|uniref:hypothetical protein n=1 Tax=Mesorhizobium sp. AaZ16 TaxID=3402289 RepID=UPI00374F0160